MMSLKELCRSKVNECINHRKSIAQLSLPGILRNWINKHYFIDNNDYILACKFNARALYQGSKMKIVRCSKGWKLEMCYYHHIITRSGDDLHIDTSSAHCVCSQLLNDPGCIFDDTPTQVPIDERIVYFSVLAQKNGSNLLMLRNGHLSSCLCSIFKKLHCRCACSRLRANPEHFFDIPMQDRYKPPTLSEVVTLQKKWMSVNWKVERFNIVYRILGKTLMFINNELNGYHLNTCWRSRCKRKDNSYILCHCSQLLSDPKNYFIESVFNRTLKSQFRHSANCVYAKMLQNPYDMRPEYIQCNVNNVINVSN